MKPSNITISLEVAQEVVNAIGIAEHNQQCGEKASEFGGILEAIIKQRTPQPEAKSGEHGGGDHTDHNQ